MTNTTAKDTGTIHCCDCPSCRQHPQGAVAVEHQAIHRFGAAADAQSRRLLVGFRAQAEGRGGVALLAGITGLDRNPIACGRRELLQGDLAAAGRGRRPGPGRKRLEAKAPGW